MAESLKRETKCVYVDTSLDTHLLVPLHDLETISDFKVKLCKEHLQCFPQLGEIDISAVKVNRQNTSGLLLDYHLPDSTLLSMVLEGIGHNCWSVYVDAAVKVEKCELPSENGLNLELLLEKDKDDSLLLDGHTKNHPLEKDLEAGVTEKTAKKRKVKVSDGQKKRKKPKVDLNQSSAAAAITASEFDVDEESHELRGNVQPEVVATESSSPRKKLDDALPETTTKETEMAEKSVEHLDMTSSELTTRPDTENKKKRKKKRSEDDINQSSAAAVTTSNVESVALATTPESLPASGEEKRGNPFAEASQKELEKSVEAEGIETHQLDTSTGLTASRPDTEKKETGKKISEDDTNQISAIANVEERVDATPASLPISREENLDDSFAVLASQKEKELVKISIGDVGRDQIDDNLVSHTANHKDTVSEVTTRPDTEKKKKKKRGKKRSKYGISQSFPASVTTSRDIVNEVEGVPIKAVEGEEPDNVIEEKNENEENNASLEVADPHELSVEVNSAAVEVADSEDLSVEVNNASLEVAQSHELPVEVNNDALEETPLMNNPQDTECNASLLRKFSEVADDDAEDKSLSKKADRGDNFGCSQNQEKPDQVAGGAKSNEGLDLHPSGSTTYHFMSGKLFFLES